VKHLRSHSAYWHEDDAETKRLLQVPVELLSKQDLQDVIVELDRRFMQLWDKVGYEREKFYEDK
jgi:hypothetical protein